MWGIHNRDYPTIWAVRLLSEQLESSESVRYFPWTSDTTELAWRFAFTLRNSGVDLSGFPRNNEKAEKSEARFVRFFVGDEPNVGPLFDLGLAANVGDDLVSVTPMGQALLNNLAGWVPRMDAPTDEAVAATFLDHLAEWVPADYAFIKSLVRLIADGISDRDSIIESISMANADWSRQVAATNVAGFIGRARQWGLIERKQDDRRYVLAPFALEFFDD